MDFEWDETKRRQNVKAHKVDFAEAAKIFLGPVLEANDERFEYPEDRITALGQWQGEWYAVIYTRRKGKRRIISAWRVGEAGRRRYQNLLRRRASGDG